jgi:arylsulfatase A-like enzyme
LARRFLLDGAERERLLRRAGPAVHQAVLRYLYEGLGDDPDGEALAAELRHAYAEGLRWVDGLLARTVERLEAWGLLENAVLVVTADHGEAFGEHGLLGHGRSLHDELVRVPLVVRGAGPWGAGRVERASVGLVDLLPTLLDVAGVSPLPGADGLSFLPVVERRERPRTVFAEELVDSRNTGLDRDLLLLSARTERWKAILTADRDTGDAREEFHDLVADPHELSALRPADATACLDAEALEALLALRARASAWLDRN